MKIIRCQEIEAASVETDGAAGCRIVLAESFARIFFRNSVATGELYPCECPDRLCDALQTGDVVRVDLDKATVTIEKTGRTHRMKALGILRFL